MGLWMKCPKCQSHNPLNLKVCAKCGISLDNLPQKERVYVLAGAVAVKPSHLLKATPTPESPMPTKTQQAQAAPKAKAPRKPRKKKD